MTTPEYEFSLIGTNSAGDKEIVASARGDIKTVTAAMRASANGLDPDPAEKAGEDWARKLIENGLPGLFGKQG